MSGLSPERCAVWGRPFFREPRNAGWLAGVLAGQLCSRAVREMSLHTGSFCHAPGDRGPIARSQVVRGVRSPPRLRGLACCWHRGRRGAMKCLDLRRVAGLACCVCCRDRWSIGHGRDCCFRSRAGGVTTMAGRALRDRRARRRLSSSASRSSASVSMNSFTNIGCMMSLRCGRLCPWYVAALGESWQLGGPLRLTGPRNDVLEMSGCGGGRDSSAVPDGSLGRAGGLVLAG